MNRAIVFVIIATLFFSSMEIALKSIAGNFSAMQVNITRFLLGGLALIPFALRDLRRGTSRLTLACVAELAVLGFLGIVLSMGFFQLAVELAPASVVAVLFCSNTAFVLVFAHLILGSPISRSQIQAIVLALCGVICIVIPFAGSLSVPTLILSLLAPSTFALYSVLSTPICRKHSGVVVTCSTFLLGSLELIVLLVLAKVTPLGDFFASHGLTMLTDVDLLGGYTFTSFLGMLYVGIGVSGIGYACYFMAAEAASPFTASLVFFFKPVLAPILAWLLIGDHIPFSMLMGILLIVSGSLCLVVARIRDINLLRSMHHLHKVYHHKRWKHDYRARHFEPHLLLAMHKHDSIRAIIADRLLHRHGQHNDQHDGQDGQSDAHLYGYPDGHTDWSQYGHHESLLHFFLGRPKARASHDQASHDQVSPDQANRDQASPAQTSPAQAGDARTGRTQTGQACGQQEKQAGSLNAAAAQDTAAGDTDAKQN